MNDKLEGEIRTGKGKSYGMEIMVRKESGRLTGFVNYTLAHTDRTIPGINEGKTYLAPNDKTHSINILASYNLSRKWDVSAEWVFSIYNAYWHKNPWMISFDQNTSDGYPQARMTYLFGAVPSITYNFKF